MYTGYYIGSSLLYSIALVLSGFNVSLSRQVALMSWGGEKKQFVQNHRALACNLSSLCALFHIRLHIVTVLSFVLRENRAKPSCTVFSLQKNLMYKKVH